MIAHRMNCQEDANPLLNITPGNNEYPWSLSHVIAVIRPGEGTRASGFHQPSKNCIFSALKDGPCFLWWLDVVNGSIEKLLFSFIHWRAQPAEIFISKFYSRNIVHVSNNRKKKAWSPMRGHEPRKSVWQVTPVLGPWAASSGGDGLDKLTIHSFDTKTEFQIFKDSNTPDAFKVIGSSRDKEKKAPTVMPIWSH